MDAYEARIQFCKLIQKLNGTATSNSVAVSFILKHEEFQETLYNCFMEELYGQSINMKINLFNLVEAICAHFSLNKMHDHPYRQWLNRDLASIVEFVVPNTRAGAVNHASAQVALRHIQQTEFLDPQVVQDQLKYMENYRPVDTIPPQQLGMDDQEILRRMNDDRERAKRLKENDWAVSYKTSHFEEFEKMWHNQGPLTELDLEQMREDVEIYNASIRPLQHK